MPFFAESWFWRGTQSAVFYYLACSPCLDYNHKRKRRNEAIRVEKERAKVETTQPGIITQPLSFQTNKAWAEEIAAGPGPPKGWKRDSLGGELSPGGGKKKGKAKIDREGQKNGPTTLLDKAPFRMADSLPTALSSNEPTRGRNESTRPAHERKSSTIDNLKDTIRSTLHPERWNWKRYEREDEVLWSANDKMHRMWDRATGQGTSTRPHDRSQRRTSSHGRKRADTNDSDRYDYHRAIHPEVNDLHPPVVSQLPARREEVAWMLLPPPSAAVMEGKVRPGAESAMRQPLARIGRTKEEEEEMRKAISESKKRAVAPTQTKEERRGRRPSAVAISRDEEGFEMSTSDAESWDEQRIKHIRGISTPPERISSSRPRPNTQLHSQKRNSWQPQRPPLALLANSHTHSPTTTNPSKFTQYFPELSSTRSSPAPSVRHKVEDHTSAEWDYYIKFELPQMPPRSRRSLPTQFWSE